jgi:hypothetical protein
VSGNGIDWSDIESLTYNPAPVRIEGQPGIEASTGNVQFQRDVPIPAKWLHTFLRAKPSQAELLLALWVLAFDAKFKVGATHVPVQVPASVIRARLGLSPRTRGRALARLVTLGLLAAHQKPGKNTTYTIVR